MDWCSVSLKYSCQHINGNSSSFCVGTLVCITVLSLSKMERRLKKYLFGFSIRSVVNDEQTNKQINAGNFVVFLCCHSGLRSNAEYRMQKGLLCGETVLPLAIIGQ